MADERLKPDANSKTVMGGLTDDANLDIVALRVDPTTKRLEVDASISSAEISGGTIDVITKISSGTINIGQIASGTVTTTITSLSSGTMNVTVNSGTITAISDGTVNSVINSGTITTVSTLSSISDGTIHVHELASGTVNVATGTMNVVVNSGTITTSVTLGSLIISDGTLSSGTVNIKELASGTVKVTSLPTVFISDGTISTLPQITIASGTISSGTVNIKELASGTVAVSTLPQVTIASGTVSSGTVNISQIASGTVYSLGNIAHDSADAGNPLKIGAKVETDLSGITAVADGDRTDIYADADGMLFVKPYASSANVAIGTGSLSAAGTIVIIPAQGATKKTHLMGISVVNNSSTNTSVYVSDGSYILKWHISAPANGGAVQSFTVPLNGSLNNSWQISPSTASGSLWVSMVGYTSVV
jgi:hypothetical protein